MGSIYAWWNLSKKQKKLLNEMRDNAGMFGGTPGRAPYFWIQEGTHNPAGAKGSGITPTHFVENTLNDIQESIADAIIAAFNGN
jgi:hypothetical protein